MNWDGKQEKVKNDEKRKNWSGAKLSAILWLTALVVGLAVLADVLIYDDAAERWQSLAALEAAGHISAGMVTGKEVEEECGCKTYYITYDYDARDASGVLTQRTKRTVVDAGLYNTLQQGNTVFVIYDPVGEIGPELVTRFVNQPYPNLTLNFTAAAGVLMIILVLVIVLARQLERINIRQRTAL